MRKEKGKGKREKGKGKRENGEGGFERDFNFFAEQRRC